MPKSSRLVLLIVIAETALLAMVYLVRSVLRAGDFGFPLDDPWIHAVLARNLVEGHGLSYNPGHPVGSTSILYTLLLAGAYRIVVAPTADAYILGLALHVGASWLVYLLVLRLTQRPGFAIASAVVFAAIPRLMWGALAGMEVPLYVFLATLGMYLHVRYRWYEGSRAYLSTAAFALAALARPECAAFIPIAVLDRMITAGTFDKAKGGLPRYATRIPLHAALAAAIIAPAVAFNLWATGKPLPLPFYVKTQFVLGQSMVRSLLGGITLVPRFMLQVVEACARDSLVVALACLAGLVVCVKWSKRPEYAGIGVLPLGMFLIPTGTALTGHIAPALDQLLFQSGRYSAYLVPIMVVLAAVGLAGIDNATRNLPLRWPFAKTGVLGLMIVATAVGLVISNCSMSDDYAWSVENINNMQVRIGKWAAGLPRDTVIAVNDAGAIAYFSRLETIDIFGVVNPEAIPYRQKYPLPSLAALRYLSLRKPDYVIIFPTWYVFLVQRTDILHPVGYCTLKHNIVCGGDTMVVYKAYW